MKGGNITGRGILTWTNGDSYEGSWLNGMMHGFGVYNWISTGCYVGTWTFGLKDGKGAFYPKGSKFPDVEEVYLKALRKRGLLPDLRRFNQVSRIQHSSDYNNNDSNVSLGRRWSMEVAIEKVIGHDLSLDIDGGEHDDNPNGPILEREYIQGILISEVVVNDSFASSKRVKRRQKRLLDVKRPGETIIKGHRSYDLMLSLQLGIRNTVGKITPIPKRDLKESDFGPRASFWMNFPKQGSQTTPPHQSVDFRWKSYCPMVFRLVLELIGQYINICLCKYFYIMYNT